MRAPRKDHVSRLRGFPQGTTRVWQPNPVPAVRHVGVVTRTVTRAFHRHKTALTGFTLAPEERVPAKGAAGTVPDRATAPGAEPPCASPGGPAAPAAAGLRAAAGDAFGGGEQRGSGGERLLWGDALVLLCTVPFRPGQASASRTRLVFLLEFHKLLTRAFRAGTGAVCRGDVHRAVAGSRGQTRGAGRCRVPRRVGVRVARGV